MRWTSCSAPIPSCALPREASRGATRTTASAARSRPCSTSPSGLPASARSGRPQVVGYRDGDIQHRGVQRVVVIAGVDLAVERPQARGGAAAHRVVSTAVDGQHSDVRHAGDLDVGQRDAIDVPCSVMVFLAVTCYPSTPRYVPERIVMSRKISGLTWMLANAPD